jgi:hypothetical protein
VAKAVDSLDFPANFRLDPFTQKRNIEIKENIISTPNEVRSFYRFDTFEFAKKRERKTFAFVFYVRQQIYEINKQKHYVNDQAMSSRLSPQRLFA